MKIKEYYIDEFVEGWRYQDENGKYYNEVMGISVNKWNGKIEFDDLFQTCNYKDFYYKLEEILMKINKLCSYQIEFDLEDENDENNSTSK